MTLQLVNTTDVADQRVLASRTLDVAAGERRTATYMTRVRDDAFRVDAFPG